MSAETATRQDEIKSRNAAACPVIRAIDQIGTPWRMNVIHALEDDEKRFNELKRATCARSKTLSEVLDELIENDVVVRRVEPQAPVAVYYSLTTKGEELLNAVAELAEWAERWDETDFEKPDHRVE